MSPEATTEAPVAAPTAVASQSTTSDSASASSAEIESVLPPASGASVRLINDQECGSSGCVHPAKLITSQSTLTTQSQNQPCQQNDCSPQVDEGEKDESQREASQSLETSSVTVDLGTSSISEDSDNTKGSSTAIGQRGTCSIESEPVKALKAPGDPEQVNADGEDPMRPLPDVERAVADSLPESGIASISRSDSKEAIGTEEPRTMHASLVTKSQAETDVPSDRHGYTSQATTEVENGPIFGNISYKALPGASEAEKVYAQLTLACEEHPVASDQPPTTSRPRRRAAAKARAFLSSTLESSSEGLGYYSSSDTDADRLQPYADSAAYEADSDGYNDSEEAYRPSRQRKLKRKRGDCRGGRQGRRVRKVEKVRMF